jgi:hypothetical protein
MHACVPLRFAKTRKRADVSMFGRCSHVFGQLYTPAAVCRGFCSAEPRTSASVNTDELQKFAKLASEWWRRDGPFAGLHSMNAVRVPYIRQAAELATGRSLPEFGRSLTAVQVLDVGCGGGILAEVRLLVRRFLKSPGGNLHIPSNSLGIKSTGCGGDCD